MRFSFQISAARALLGWSQSTLARSADVGFATLQLIEQSDGVVKGKFTTVLKSTKFLITPVFFTDDQDKEIGVRLRRRDR